MFVIDLLSDLMIILFKIIVKLLDDYLVPDLSWNHMELLLAKETGKLVNSKILELLSKYVSNSIDK